LGGITDYEAEANWSARFALCGKSALLAWQLVGLSSQMMPALL